MDVPTEAVGGAPYGGTEFGRVGGKHDEEGEEVMRRQGVALRIQNKDATPHKIWSNIKRTQVDEWMWYYPRLYGVSPCVKL